MYKGTAKLPDGQTIEVRGTFQECACWAENVIRSNPGNVDIRIREVAQ